MYHCGQAYWSIIPPVCHGCSICKNYTKKPSIEEAIEALRKVLDKTKPPKRCNECGLYDKWHLEGCNENL